MLCFFFKKKNLISKAFFCIDSNVKNALRIELNYWIALLLIKQPIIASKKKKLIEPVTRAFWFADYVFCCTPDWF